MYILEGFSPEQIKQIYKTVILYSIENYEKLPKSYQEILSKKYENAIQLKNNLSIIDDKDGDKFSFLQEQKQIVERIKEQNQPIITEIAGQVVAILKKEMPLDLTEKQKAEYIFDYVTKTMQYSTDWYLYCNNIPPIGGLEFTFYNGVPLSTTYQGLLVTRQGTCEEIANLMIYLGRELGIHIERETCYHNDNMHAINYIGIHRQKSYMDATSVICQLKTKEEACLVSQEKLNIHNDYRFTTKASSITTTKQKPKYDMNSIIQKTMAIMPNIHYLKSEKLEK